MWVLHLVSDMAGSSVNPGKGTGIPGPILSFFKEISTMPIRRLLKRLLRNMAGAIATTDIGYIQEQY